MTMIDKDMKKLAAITSSIGYLISSGIARAADIQIQPPVNEATGQQLGYSSINDFINKAIQLVFIVAVLGVLVMLIVGAVQWIFSGGNKEAVDGARKRITNALIGLAILAVAFALARVAGQFLGFDLFAGFNIPHPG